MKKETLIFDAYGFPKQEKENKAKAKASKEILGYAIGKSEVGLILVATFELGILAVLHGKTKSALQTELVALFPKDRFVKGKWDAERALSEVIRFIDKPGQVFDYPVFMQGTAFQKKVWQAVQQVPIGETATYSQIAEKIGAPRAMRAVGSSCTRNKLFFLVPCHRIVSQGYIAGKEALGMREMLLARESALFC